MDTGILDVTSVFVIDELKRQGTEVIEGRFRFQSMLEADEAWMTNSVLEIIPFSKIEEVPLPGADGKNGAIAPDAVSAGNKQNECIGGGTKMARKQLNSQKLIHTKKALCPIKRRHSLWGY